VNQVELASLTECEAVIQHSIDSFLEAGRALMAIRDQRLYKGRYATFDEYCHTRWGFTRQRSSQLIGAAEVAAVVADAPASSNGHLPAPAPIVNERVARELAPLRGEPERMREVWQDATAQAAEYGRQATSSDVRRIVRGQAMGEVTPSPQEPQPGSQVKVDEIVEDWALIARGAKQVLEKERAAVLAHDLTDNQRWRIEEARKHAWMVIDNEF
jgi:hypothetical protein